MLAPLSEAGTAISAGTSGVIVTLAGLLLVLGWVVWLFR